MLEFSAADKELLLELQPTGPLNLTMEIIYENVNWQNDGELEVREADEDRNLEDDEGADW